MNYYSEISNIITQRRDADYQSVLDSPQFVILLGEGIREEAVNICQELSSRWSNAPTNVFVLSIAISGSTIKPSLSIQNGITFIRYQIGRQEMPSNKLLYLNIALRTVVDKAVRAVRSLLNSRIVIVGRSDDEAVAFTGQACMILNELLFNRGGTVSSRQYFCFIPEDATRNTDLQYSAARLLKEWDTKPIPKDNLLALQDNGGFHLYPCDGRIAGKRIFHQIVLLGRLDSDGFNYDQNGERVALFGNLMDPRSGIYWQENSTCIHTAYTYPSELDQGIDIVDIWRILHERFTGYFSDCGSSEMKVAQEKIAKAAKQAHDKIIGLLRLRQDAVTSKMNGFTMYNSEAFDACRGKAASLLHPKLPTLEKSIFGRALANKFDYLWIVEMQSDEEIEAIVAWEASIQSALKQTWNEEVLLSAELHIPEGKDAASHAPISNDDRINHISDLIQSIVVNLYPSKNAEKAKDFFKACNEKVDAMVQERIRVLRKVGERIGRPGIEMYIDNTEEEYKNDFGRFLSADLDLKTRRNLIAAEITQADVETYAQAICEDDYERQILNTLKDVSAKIAQSGRVAPLKLPEPDPTNQKWTCQFTITPPPLSLDHGYPQIVSGKGKGLYYLTRTVDMGIDSVSVFSGAQDLVSKNNRSV